MTRVSAPEPDFSESIARLRDSIEQMRLAVEALKPLMERYRRSKSFRRSVNRALAARLHASNKTVIFEVDGRPFSECVVPARFLKEPT